MLNGPDLDRLLVEEDLFYKSVCKSDLLSVNGLRTSAHLYDYSVALVFGGLEIKMAAGAADTSFFQSIVRDGSNDSFFSVVCERFHNSCYTIQ